jgi:hypothetical protein
LRDAARRDAPGDVNHAFTSNDLESFDGLDAGEA